MNNSIETKGISFWNFIQRYKIEIPIIQRDYAQGRLGKENLRKNFLGDLKKALERKDNAKMKLDFVYGSVEGGKLNPLDGQQRLTTLWLLHWYIALRAGVLNEENCKIFRQFTYETRISSREFCENLCIPEHFRKFKVDDVVEFITKQTWFYSAWKQDPTIQSMLRMLGGTKISDKNGEDIIDGIEELFECPTNCEIKNSKSALLRVYQGYWDKLTGQNCPIVFYHLPLKDFGLSDDLYIKMNARGKQLTSFENFKADLIGYIKRQSEEDKIWNDLLDAKNGIPIKLDSSWTNIFWRNKSSDNGIDDIYYTFINRFFLNELICLKDKDSKELITAEDIEKNPVFTYLYGNKGDDSTVEYVGIEKYYFKEKSIPKLFFDNLRSSLDRYNHAIKVQASWAEDEFPFIPKYDGKSISKIGQKERVVFFAVSRYLQKGDYEKHSFGQWMRIVWNIVENGGIDTISSMVGVMRLIDELSTNSHEIYEFLAHANYEKDIKSNAAEKQVREEIAKAKQIANKTFTENEIRDAEKHPLLKGCISTLFEDDNCERISFGQSIQERINLLDKLWNKENEKDYILVKVLISWYNREIPEGKLYLKKNQDNWKNLVTDKLKDSFRKNKDNTFNEECKDWKRYLSSTDLIEKSRDTGKILSTYWDGKVVLWGTSGCSWNAYENVILDNLHCNQVIIRLIKDQIIKCDQKIKDCDFLWGWDVRFKYNKNGVDYYFVYYTNNTVYLMEKDWSQKRKKNNSIPETPENTYFFAVNYDDGVEDLCHNLNLLIEESV